MTKLFKAHFFLLILVFASCVSSNAKKSENLIKSDPQLTIKVKDQVRVYSRTQMLQLSDVRQVTIENDPTYSMKKKTYTAVPVTTLFQNLKVDATQTLLFSCLDGFSAPISASRLLNSDPKESIAYIAIESSDQKWSSVKADKSQTAGPFYLIWEHPEKSKIVVEEWPYQLAGFEAKPSIQTQFPGTIPDPRLTAKSSVQQGYQIFMRNCFACHTLNGEGSSQMGPDLNQPYNPTEYLKKDFLFKLVRNPQSLRRWPQAKMPAFDKTSLPDEDLQKIILYLQHMSKRKTTSFN